MSDTPDHTKIPEDPNIPETPAVDPKPVVPPSTSTPKITQSKDENNQTGEKKMHSGGWWTYGDGDTYFKYASDGVTLMASKQKSSKGRDRDHIHWHNNHGQGPRSAKVKKAVIYPSGEIKPKQINKGIESDLFDAFKKFMGF